MFLPVFYIALRRKFSKGSISTVSFRMLVVVYAPSLRLSFLLLLIRLVIGLGQVHVVSHDVDIRACSHGLVDREMKEEIPLVLQIKEERIDISETEMAQEQNVHEHARTPILHLKNQHPNQVHHQVYNLLFPILCPSLRCLKSAFPSWRDCTIKLPPSTGPGNTHIVDDGKDVPLSLMTGIMLTNGILLIL